MNNYTPVIGLEVHVELKTNSKMFCACSADYFGQKPNTHTCPVCLGLPGALPVPNKKAIEWCVMIGMALGCEIPLLSKFDRKNYFYPDLAKGYQISQYDEPFAINGKMVLSDGKVIRIRRAHMEEDTGKLIHGEVNGEKVSLIDFNRSGVPLVEIVTEPDFDNAQQVKEYLQKLQQIVRYLGVATADMEKGEMRLEPNISLRPSMSSPTPIGDPGKHINIDSRLSHKGTTFIEGSRGNDKEEKTTDGFDLPSYKVEVKNINSFAFVEKAIIFETKRQAELLDKGEIPAQETRGFVEEGSKTVSQRSKEEAQDYRYFPEPDIPAITWTDKQLAVIRSQVPELPEEKKTRFMSQYGITDYHASVLTKEKSFADFYETCIDVNQALATKNEANTDAKTIANWMINKKVDMANTLSAELIKQIIMQSTVSGVSEEELQTVLQKVISTNEKVVADYKNGKESAIMYLVGQAMKELRGKEKADKIREALVALLRQ